MFHAKYFWITNYFLLKNPNKISVFINKGIDVEKQTKKTKRVRGDQNNLLSNILRICVRARACKVILVPDTFDTAGQRARATDACGPRFLKIRRNLPSPLPERKKNKTNPPKKSSAAFTHPKRLS